MKKIILYFGLLVGVSCVAQAQSIKYGVKAGASLTNFTGGGSEGGKNLFGFHGGLVANFGINDAFSIQPELLYSMKGYKVEIGSPSSTSGLNTAFRLHYIDIPVLARVTAGGLFFEVGPQVGFLVAAKQKSEITGGSGAGIYYADLTKLYNTIDFGYAAGLGYQLNQGPDIGLRYNGGFTHINEGSTRNSAFQLYLTYMLGGK